MRIRILIHFLLSLCVLCCAMPTLVGAMGQVAVMPVQDLSQGEYGVNMVMTGQLHQRLTAKGIDLLAPDEMMAFLVRNRIRTLGEIETRNLRKLAARTEVTYLLLSTITQSRQSKDYALALNMHLVQVDNGTTVWSTSIHGSQADEKHLFGLAEPDTFAAVENLVLDRLLAQWPATLILKGAPPSLAPLIEVAYLSADRLQPGEIVSCRIKLNELRTPRPQTKVELLVAGKAIATRFRADQNDYVSSWPAPASDGHYQVHLLRDGSQSSVRRQLIGSFVVDSKPPQLALQLKGQERRGKIVLQNKVIILPRQQNFEPITRWQLAVQSDGGNQILQAKGQGGLPERLAWWGQEKNGALVEDGYYEVVLEAWDAAGNKGQIANTIRVKRSPPEVEIALHRKKQAVEVRLGYDGDIALEQWHVELRNEYGVLLLTEGGTELAESQVVSVDVPPLPGDLHCQLNARDVVGNELSTSVVMAGNAKPTPVKGQGLFMAQGGGESTDLALNEVWVEDF